jgi:hypothetical protein
MAFFQGDLDPIYLREQYKQVCSTKHGDRLSETLQTRQEQVEQTSSFTTTNLFHHLFKRSLNEPKATTITTDPMNRLVSFHL